MAFIIQNNRELKIYCAPGQKAWVMLAAEDLAGDISRLCTQCVFTDSEQKADIVIVTDRSAVEQDEGFSVKIMSDKVYLTGHDDLGTMWAIYTFAEKELKIPPTYLFDGSFPPAKACIEIASSEYWDYPKTKFRGWFINDEDLLAGYQSHGERDIDYRFYKKVIAPALMEKIAKTALRNKINLIIPSTLVDICNKYERNLVSIVASHGLYVSQHHIEPLGVSHFGMKKFLAENGYPAEISYVSNKEGMEATWRHYTKLWAQYPRVYYQLGLRGASDVPVWVSDKNVGQSDSERGALICDAIQAQYNIVHEYASAETHSSMTVWMEGAALLDGGYLNIPEDTTLVFADIGASQMFGADFFNVRRDSVHDYGIYYHAGYWNVGPHLAEGVLPQKMQYIYELARSKGDTHYSVLNVANIKEFVFSISENAALVWQGDDFDYPQWQAQYCERSTPGHRQELADAIDIFFSAFADVGDTEYRGFCQRNHFTYIDYPNVNFPIYALNDGFVTWYIRRPLEDNAFNYYNPEILPALAHAKQKMGVCIDRLDEIYNELEGSMKNAFGMHWYYQAHYWYSLTSAALCIAEGIESVRENRNSNISANYETAANHIQNILEWRDKLYVGQWKNWFAFETKLDMPRMHQELLKIAKGG